MVHNNSTKNIDLLKAYTSVYAEETRKLDKELVDPPADPQGEMGNYGPKGSPKKPHGGDHARITGESEPRRKGRYRVAYEEFKNELKSYHIEKFNEWIQSLADEGYDVSKWESEELIETYIQENNLWKSVEIIYESLLIDEAVVYGGEKKEPKDERMVVTQADKSGNTSAWQKYKSGDKRYKPADHLKNSYESEGEQIDELNRYAKETGRSFRTGKSVTKGGTMGGDDTHSKVMRHMHNVMGAGRMGAGGVIQPRGVKKKKGAPTPGPRVTPEQKVAKRRADAQRAQEFQNDTKGT